MEKYSKWAFILVGIIVTGIWAWEFYSESFSTKADKQDESLNKQLNSSEKDIIRELRQERKISIAQDKGAKR